MLAAGASDDKLTAARCWLDAVRRVWKGGGDGGRSSSSDRSQVLVGDAPVSDSSPVLVAKGLLLLLLFGSAVMSPCGDDVDAEPQAS